MALQKKGAPIGIGVTPAHKLHMVTSGAAVKDIYIDHTLANGTGLATTYRPVDVQANISATDLAAGTLIWSGIRSGITFGDDVASVGTAHSITADFVVEGAGNADNEYTPLFAALRYDIGTGFTQTAGPTGRGWLADLNVHGSIAAQPDMLNGLTVFYNNYYNGSPADSPAGGIWLVTRKGQGGGKTATHAAANTYPIDVGLGIVGDSNAGASAVGWTKAIQIGGFGSGWKESGSSYIGTGIDISEFATFGIHIHDRLAGQTGPAIAVASTAGSVLIGGIAALASTAKLEVIGPGAATDPLFLLGNTSGAHNYSFRFRNGSGSLNYFVAGASNFYITGVAAGDGGIAVSTSGKMFHLGGTTKVITVTAANTLGFFAATPVAQQTGGAATADTTWSQNEVDMLNSVWTALRAYGLLT